MQGDVVFVVYWKEFWQRERRDVSKLFGHHRHQLLMGAHVGGGQCLGGNGTPRGLQQFSDLRLAAQIRIATKRFCASRC